jgi:sucrose-phosphate synthase
LAHTGHSLGRVKRQRLLASGVKQEAIDARYNIDRRINAEEETLAAASLVITSTTQEIEEQYGLYDHYQPERMSVIPPGTDLERFQPPDGSEQRAASNNRSAASCTNRSKPMILALSRPDERKNIATLIEAYGESSRATTRREPGHRRRQPGRHRELDSGAQQVLTDILILIDLYDLYGRVAYPKHHSADEVPILYKLTAASRGVFINPALTEPFGLTLIEAAASGLPIVATEDGGPIDIIKHCNNGILIDPLDKQDITKALLKVLSDRGRWRQLARNGVDGVKRHYSWPAHAESYMAAVQPLLAEVPTHRRSRRWRRPLLYHDRAIFTDLDQNLLGDPDSLADFIRVIRENRKCTSFGIATGRRLDSALAAMRRYGIPRPDVLITGLGTEIFYAPQLTRDRAWARYIDHLWYPRRVRDALADLPGIQAPAAHRAEPLQGQLLHRPGTRPLPGGDRQPAAPGGPERAAEPLLRPVPGRGPGARIQGTGAALRRRPMGHSAGTLPRRRRLRRRRRHDARQHPGRGRRQPPQRGTLAAHRLREHLLRRGNPTPPASWRPSSTIGSSTPARSRGSRTHPQPPGPADGTIAAARNEIRRPNRHSESTRRRGAQ